MDPITTLGAGMSVLASKDLLNKLLGPTADYLGEEIRGLVEKCNVNLDNVFRNATSKLGDRLMEPGRVSPRVLKSIVNEGRFCDDPIMVEYLGGILATAREGADRDDRGVFYLGIVESLSAYQIRTHFLVYSAIVRHGPPLQQDLSHWYKQDTIAVAFLEEDYAKAMECSDDEDGPSIAYHAFLGLEQKALTEGGTFVKEPSQVSSLEAPYRYVWPTRHGFGLFLWALGYGNRPVNSYFDLAPDSDLPIEPALQVRHMELGKCHL